MNNIADDHHEIDNQEKVFCQKPWPIEHMTYINYGGDGNDNLTLFALKPQSGIISNHYPLVLKAICR
ncbi:MAG TPA: hypothetical protein PKX78_02980 [Candidatus Woesebacteria bacterium]|nr:hypothetical protein [Candidatus Woesebacteria bacterium]